MKLIKLFSCLKRCKKYISVYDRLKCQKKRKNLANIQFLLIFFLSKFIIYFFLSIFTQLLSLV